MSDSEALWFWCDSIGDYACVKIYSRGEPRWASAKESMKVLGITSTPSVVITPMKFAPRARL
jgi:hypothetical protein